MSFFVVVFISTFFFIYILTMYSLFFSVPAYYSNGFFVFFCFFHLSLFYAVFMLCLFADNVFQCCLMITFFFHHGRSRLRFLPWDLPVNLYPCTFPCSRLMNKIQFNSKNITFVWFSFWAVWERLAWS